MVGGRRHAVVGLRRRAADRGRCPAGGPRGPAGVRPGGPRRGAVLVKHFHDIASADLDTLLPDVRMVMNVRDRWTLVLPAVFGGIPLVLKLVPTLEVLFLLAGVELGSSGTVEADHLKQALAVLTGRGRARQLRRAPVAEIPAKGAALPRFHQGQPLFPQRQQQLRRLRRAGRGGGGSGFQGGDACLRFLRATRRENMLDGRVENWLIDASG